MILNYKKFYGVSAICQRIYLLILQITMKQELQLLIMEKLDDFEVESNKKNAVKGDVYLAKITRVEPSLQAAFVDFGKNRNGFFTFNGNSS